jgi:acyl-CoA dehydrogenase
MPRLQGGDLVGIALTEAGGGTGINQAVTRARRVSSNEWRLTGEKLWISRIQEASCFIVFFKFDGSHELSAAIIETDRNGLHREELQPSGLTGWSWGRLRFQDVLVGPDDLLGAIDGGFHLFADHFTYYRPMVAMTALGAATAAFDLAAEFVHERLTSKKIRQPRDTILDDLGRSLVQIRAAILVAVDAISAYRDTGMQAFPRSALAKAHGVDAAYGVVDRLRSGMGAVAIQSQHAVHKIQADLNAFRIADGMHVELIRSAAKAHLTSLTI